MVAGARDSRGWADGPAQHIRDEDQREAQRGAAENAERGEERRSLLAHQGWPCRGRGVRLARPCRVSRAREEGRVEDDVGRQADLRGAPHDHFSLLFLFSHQWQHHVTSVKTSYFHLRWLERST